ncbi:hypothetical protein ACFFP0_14330 [Rhizobium puerariae]|uniref:Uncharacterized protein n=1 Tax=Rhizobium puerariae TaxID=1585791 RepID=A0ABV6AHE4_9HYPH
MSFADDAKQFWSATYFLRRAQGRDTRMAVKVLRRLTGSSNATIAAKAEQSLVEHEAATRRMIGAQIKRRPAFRRE